MELDSLQGFGKNVALKRKKPGIFSKKEDKNNTLYIGRSCARVLVLSPCWMGKMTIVT